MFLDMSGTGEPHCGLGRLFVRKRTRWPHLCTRIAGICDWNPLGAGRGEVEKGVRAIGGKKPPLQHSVLPTYDEGVDSAGVDDGKNRTQKSPTQYKSRAPETRSSRWLFSMPVPAAEIALRSGKPPKIWGER